MRRESFGIDANYARIRNFLRVGYAPGQMFGAKLASVPAGSLPVIAVILGYLHLPPEGIGIILGVDRFLAMCRTAWHVTGDLATAVVVANPERLEAST